MTTLSVIVPTWNEKENVPILMDRLMKVLEGISAEIIVVDDNSRDRTWEVVEHLHEKYFNVRGIRRIGRSGLASAVIEGVLASHAEFVAVIDADLQHDETRLPPMLRLAQEGADVVVGSRYLNESGTGDWAKERIAMSRLATILSSKISRHKISDPMSGFFLIRRKIFCECVEKLEGRGFKILLDILTHYSPEQINIKEISYVFNPRHSGESKLSSTVIVQFLEFLIHQKVRKYISPRFLRFAMVGSWGALVHFSLLYLFYKHFQFTFQGSLIIAIESAIVVNYVLNNLWTYSEVRKRGRDLFGGFLKYNLATSVGGVTNFMISSYLIGQGFHWVSASLIGAAIGVLWNYTLSKMFTWGSNSYNS